MRGHIGRHADRDAGSTVQKEERSLRREDRRFFERIVEIQGHVDRILVHIPEDVLGHFLEFRFGISHGRRRIAVHGTEVTLALDEGVSLVPFLAEADHCVVDAGVAVRVELTHHLTDDPG